jgi:hypothetical protein
VQRVSVGRYLVCSSVPGQWKCTRQSRGRNQHVLRITRVRHSSDGLCLRALSGLQITFCQRTSEILEGPERAHGKMRRENMVFSQWSWRWGPLTVVPALGRPIKPRHSHADSSLSCSCFCLGSEPDGWWVWPCAQGLQDSAFCCLISEETHGPQL